MKPELARASNSTEPVTQAKHSRAISRMSLIPPSPGTENVQVNGDAALGKLFIELRHCTGRDELAHHLAIASGSGACLEQEHILQLDGSAFHARQLSDVADLARTAGEA